MFCIKCGKKASVDVFCDNCFLSQNSLFELKDFSLAICNCGKYYERSWIRNGNIENVIENQIKNRMKVRGVIKKTSIKLRRRGSYFIATVTCSGRIKPCKKMKKEEKTITVAVKKRQCDICSKISGGYYEAVLQLRGKNAGCLLKRLELPETAAIQELKVGYDVKLLKKKDAYAIIKDLKPEKKSFKFVGTKKGRKIYRDYYLFR